MDEETARERRNLRHREWEKANSEYLNAKRRKARQENPERFKLAYQRRQENETQRIAGAMRSSIRRAFKLKRAPSDKNSREWEALVGYTARDLIAHIERQLTGKMSWANFGKWHIDHIRPVSSFNFASVTDPAFRECWALTNLRPMWATPNRRKAAARTHLL